MLVAHASADGSTKGIASGIADRLRASGIHVDLRPVDEVETLDGLDVVVLGSAIHSGTWLPEPAQIGEWRERLAPRGHRNFAGVLERSRWGRLGTVFLRALGGTFGDHRDWKDVDRWASEIAVALES